MAESVRLLSQSLHLKRSTLIIAVVWTATIILVSGWHLLGVRKSTLEAAHIQAADSFEKDLVYRRWATGHGGVYVPITEQTPPNPYLSHIEDRDITTTSGLDLTLMNPAYMTRQVHELGLEQYGHQGHITSLNPIRPENAPDAWEAEALRAFERGETEVVELTSISDTRYLRLMRPLITEEQCLKCHAIQGYEEGDLRGGISVSVPMEPLWANMYNHMTLVTIGYAFIWLLGLGGISVSASRFGRRIQESEQVGVALLESEERFRSLFENAPLGYQSLNEQGDFIEVNETWCEVLGYRKEEVLGRNFTEFLHPDFRERFREHFPLFKSAGYIRDAEFGMIRKDGTGLLVAINGKIGRNEDGSFRQTHCVLQDITQLKQAEEAVQESEDKYRTYIENSPGGIFLVDSRGNYLDVNPSACLLTGYSREELLNMSIPDLASPESSPEMLESFLELRNTGEIEAEILLRRKDGSDINVSFDAVNLSDDRFLAFCFDITERKQAEAALAETAELLESTLESTDNGILVVDNDGKVITANGMFAELWNIPEEILASGDDDRLLDNVLSQLVEPDQFLDKVRDLYSKPDAESFDTLQFNDGRVFERYSQPLLKSGQSAGRVWSFRDVSERKQAEKEKALLEEQYHQAQKVESIGQLAGGVAHDLNNLLAPIIGYSEMLLDDIGLGDVRKKRVEHILQAGFRSRDLVRQLLAFGRKQTLEYRPVDMNQAVEAFEQLFRRTIREDIEIKIILSPDIKIIRADIGQIEQVIINLTVNAQDAMPRGGTLTIETAQVELDEEFAATHEGTKPGEYVMMAVSDTGHGMDDETRKQIFEPFFSTKGDLGTGLGLSTVYGIIKQHDGNIWVYSEPGQGTTIKVYLPVSGNVSVEEEPDEETATDPGGSETILLVEDDEQVRDLANTVLKQKGYSVLAAGDGSEALTVLESHDGPVHLLLTDVIMPGMDGKDLFTRVVETYPDLKVLYMSGYTDNVIAHRGVLDEGVAFIQKPFNIQALAARVREVLEEE